MNRHFLFRDLRNTPESHGFCYNEAYQAQKNIKTNLGPSHKLFLDPDFTGRKEGKTPTNDERVKQLLCG